MQTVTKEYSCYITIYILVLATEVLTRSKEYSAAAGIHKAGGEPGHRLPSPLNSRPFTGRVSRPPWLLRRVVGAQVLARRPFLPGGRGYSEENPAKELSFNCLDKLYILVMLVYIKY